MNSDPYDSAAWRTFGMLDADESAIFDEAMRHDPVLRSAYLEMDRLSAAVGAASVAPLEPRAGQLERLQHRLGLYPVRRLHFWMGVSGWAAAAVLALLMVFTRGGNQAVNPETMAGPSTPSDTAPITVSPPPTIAPTPSPDTAAVAAQPSEGNTVADTAAKEAAALTAAEVAEKAKVEKQTKHLVQEIETLRDNLERFQQRDRILFEAVPGVAVPIVMTMRPPGLESDGDMIIAQNDTQVSITGMLGDAMKLINGARSRTGNPAPEPAITANLDSALVVAAGDAVAEGAAAEGSPSVLADPAQLTPVATASPSAVPIYDAARDTGTLVVNNLPVAGDGKVYNLWVHTMDGDAPIYVGSLPVASTAGTDSFDFSLGSTNVLPSGFVLTKDEVNQPVSPTSTNTVLQGPTPAGR